MPALSPYPNVGGTLTGQARGPAPTIEFCGTVALVLLKLCDSEYNIMPDVRCVGRIALFVAVVPTLEWRSIDENRASVPSL